MPVDAFVNNLNTSDSREQNMPAIVSDDEEDNVEPKVSKEKEIATVPNVERKAVEPVRIAERNKQTQPTNANKYIDVNQAHDQWGH